jgi:hypothetical protein
MNAEDAAIPKPPDGYRPAVQFEYPKMQLQVAAIVVLVFTAPLWLVLAWVLQRQQTANLFVGTAADLVLILVTVLVTTAVHELVHGGAYRLLGYRVTFGISGHLFAVYAAAFGQWQTRNHNLVVALAPLVVLTLALVPLLAIQSHAAALVGLTALLMNTGGAVGDFYLAWRLLGLPRSALLYDVDPKTMLVFEPSAPQ